MAKKIVRQLINSESKLDRECSLNNFESKNKYI